MANDRQAQADKQAQDALCVMMGFMETTLALAAPRLMAKTGRIPSREEVLSVLDEHNRIFSAAKANPNTEEGKEQMRVAPLAIKLRELLSNWTPSKDVPPEIVAQARTILAAMNVDEPAEGWDNYEGEPEQRTSTSEIRRIP